MLPYLFTSENVWMLYASRATDSGMSDCIVSCFLKLCSVCYKGEEIKRGPRSLGHQCTITCCEISGSRGGVYEDESLLRYSTV
jgi:hypothetical protein